MKSNLVAAFLLLLFSLLAQVDPNSRKKKGPQLQLPMERKVDRRSRSETKFLLYSNTAEEGCLVEYRQQVTLEKCRFNASLPLVMIVHGWSVEGRLEGWIWKLAEALKSSLPQTNVVIADWLTLAHAHYATAVQGTRRIGQEIAHFLEWLEESMEFSRDNAHLIGYSLGAHVAGFAGSSIGGAKKIGRITGLDPAGPLFEGMSPTDRLSPDDASFVDAIHTFTQQQMGLSVGIKQPVAHFDFYPNGGTFQPGCHIMHVYNHIVHLCSALSSPIPPPARAGLTQTVKCAHERSVHLFIDSLRHAEQQMRGYQCKDMQTFDKGRCLHCRAKRCNTLGYHIRKARVAESRQLFLQTQSQAPFKVYHYQFKIHFINEFQVKQIDPTFTISLTGSKDDVENLSMTLVEGITGNKTYAFLVPLDTDIGELMMIKLKWEGIAIWKNIWNTVQTIIPWTKGGHRPGLVVKTIRVKAGETQQRMTFCSQNVDNLHLYPGQEKMFVRCEFSY
ncbi:hypothetical protein JRQ81_006931 [Phrynocephalus forsythii]|uniref:Hepatic triacylglycerol lipase n=1 Tax=Phrynocephalus forsythii TaxID=171643 RepID=A0A9Q1AU57_9SAUR|nr:hypothetical protein JRQ81_006931 [Phrynocephalus forsythii]